MSKAQYILLAAIIGFYSALFVSLLVRGFIGLRQSQRPRVVNKPQLEKISRVVQKARNRAWTRAVWRGPLAHEAR
jgi:hypothetical protein